MKYLTKHFKIYNMRFMKLTMVYDLSTGSTHQEEALNQE
jgi:hypothetical protein